MPDPPDTSCLQHPRFARFYIRLSQAAERHGGAEHRERLLKGLSGTVIEVGAGNGLNFGHYPPTVTEVLAVEPDDVLRKHGDRRAADAPVTVTLVAGHADALPADEGSFDAAVVSLVLCSVADPSSALAEIHRVLRPGGELRFYEHVRSPRDWIGHAQDLLTPAWRRAFGACHPNRDTLKTIRESGFEIIDVDTFGVGIGPLAVTHVLGSARRS